MPVPRAGFCMRRGLRRRRPRRRRSRHPSVSGLQRDSTPASGRSARSVEPRHSSHEAAASRRAATAAALGRIVSNKPTHHASREPLACTRHYSRDGGHVSAALLARGQMTWRGHTVLQRSIKRLCRGRDALLIPRVPKVTTVQQQGDKWSCPRCHSNVIRTFVDDKYFSTWKIFWGGIIC
jgi:hypothetical protein